MNEPAIVCRNEQCEEQMRASIQDIIQQYRTQNTDIAYRSLRSLAGRTGLESAHIGVDATLAHLWLNQRNDVYRPHMVRAMAALQRHETTVLMGWHAARTVAAWFCVVQQILANPSGRILVVVADSTAGLAAYQSLTKFIADLPAELVPRFALVHNDAAESDAHIVIATYQRLNRELLKKHDGDWKPFWGALHCIVLLDLQKLSGIAYQHASWLLRRMERIRSYHAVTKPLLIMTATPARNSDLAIQGLCVGEHTIVQVEDVPTPPLFLLDAAVDSQPYQHSAGLAMVLCNAGYQVHIVVSDICAPIIWQLALDGPTHGSQLVPADVVIFAGMPANSWAVDEAMNGGYQAVLTIHGSAVADILTVRDAREDVPLWVCGSANTYVHTVHLLAAAAEIPLLEREVTSWGLQALTVRMQEQGFVRSLPGNLIVPASEDDPHAEFSLYDAIGLPATVRYDGESLSTPATATLYERWLAPRMAVPPWIGGMVVTSRDIDDGSVTIAIDTQSRLTLPIRRTRVEPTDTSAGTASSGFARVAVHDALIGMREWQASEWHDTAYPDAFDCTWYAPSCWWYVGNIPDYDVPWLGWSLIAATQHWLADAFEALVPCYDGTSGRLYLVEAQPGGTGLLHIIAPFLGDILAAAQQQGTAMGVTGTLIPFMRVDATWLTSALAPDIPKIRAEPIALPPALHESDSDDIREPTFEGKFAADPTAPVMGVDSDSGMPSTDTDMLMATLLDTTLVPGGSTEPMSRVDSLPWHAQLQEWLGGVVARWGSTVPSSNFVLGDAVICIPYGDGVIVDVHGDIYIVATQLYGDVRIDSRRDLVMKRDVRDEANTIDN